MPTRDQVLQVPFVGGIDEYTDPDQLQPPSMASLTNCVVRKTGRIEKREGFQYLQKTGVANTPADTFSGSTLSEKMEALGAHSGSDGSKLLLAADSKLYEYVGLDATHGYREVNRIPACLGTLHSVDATGGTVTEVESMLNDSGTLRCTVWIIGYRNGQDLTNDSAINEQPLDAPGMYVAVQRVSDGSFVTAPRRIELPGGGVMTQCGDLRVTKYQRASSSARDWLIAYRYFYSAIAGFTVSSDTGAITAAQTITAFASRPYHRSFDVTGVPGSNRVLFAFCDAQSTAANEDIQLRTASISIAGTFVLSGVYALITNLNATGFTGGGVYTWQGFKARGVVLETEPKTAGAIAVGARLIYSSSAAPTKLDGKMIVSSVGLVIGANPAADVISVAANKFGVLHRIGFKTDESLTGSFVGAGAKFLSSSVRMLYDIKNPTPGISASYGTIYVTGQFGDGTYEVYSAMAVQAFGAVYSNLNPYKATELQNISAVGYPKSSHIYDGISRVAQIQSPVAAATPVPTGTVKINKQQVTRVVFDNTKGIAGLNGWVARGTLQVGATTICEVMIYFSTAASHYTELAIVNGNPGFNVAASPSTVNVTQFTITSFSWPGSTPAPPAPALGVRAVGAGDLVAHDELNSAFNYSTMPVGTDIADQTSQVSQAWFDSTIAPEPCVHRWDVTTASNDVILAMSSTSAGVMSNPNGDVPLGYVSPFAENNYFEVYEYPSASSTYDLNKYAGASSTTMWTALGGPWRLISSLCKGDDGRLYCVVTPSGDDFQRSAFLVSFARPSSLVSVSTPKPLSAGATAPATAEGYTYSGSQGIFVESLNMARIAAVPLNCPRLVLVESILVASVGSIRQGLSTSGSEVFATDYDYKAHTWRSLRAWGDYTMANGGLLTAFDGSTANEATVLLWPQRDLTSIAYERLPTKLYSVTQSSTQQYAGTGDGPNAYHFYGSAATYLNNITRPWFAYESGFNGAYGVATSGDVEMAWNYMSTFWGGKATDDYQVVYSDPRMLQVSSVSRPASASGLNEASVQHYYGRYQSGYSTGELGGLYDERFVIWAPRANSGAATPADSKYTPTTANGDFLVRWCYEAVDGTGRVVRSAPSQAVTFSICCCVRYNKDQYGGIVDEYRYGFFVPRLELTNRLKTAESDSKRMVLQPYFTAEPFATVFYKVPFSSFLTGYSQAFIVPRNLTRGVVAYSGTAGPGSQYGIVTSNFQCFDGPQGDYNGLLTQPVLYTVGGGLDNVAPPSARCMTVHQNRLVLGGADDATVVWFSKELSPTDAPGFNDALTIQIEDGGPVTGLASMESLLVVFKRDMTFIVPGDMPDDTGGSINRGYVSNTLGTPVRMPHGIGCIDHRAVVETPIGVFFQSQRTIELLSRDMSITPIGLKLDDTLTLYPEVTAAVHNPKDTEVWFALRNPESTANIFAVYNYMTDVWATHTFNMDASGPVTFPMTVMDNIVYFATNWSDSLGVQPLQTVVYKQTDDKFFDVAPSGRKYVSMAWKTAPISLNQVQGYQRMKRIRVFGSPIPTLSTGAAQTRDPHGVSFTLQTDYVTTGPNLGTQSAAWTEAEATAVYAAQNREVYEVHIAEQKGQKLTLSYVETAPANINTLTHGYGTAFSNMAFVVGLKAGLDKRITNVAKR